MSDLILTWFAADLRTGVIQAELPAFTTSGPIGRRLGASVTAQGGFAPSGAPVGWRDATVPGRSMMVAVDTAAWQPVWAGMTMTRATGSANAVPMGLLTPEGYLDRRYTGNYTTAVATDQATILTGTGTALTVNAPCFVLDAPASGLTLDGYTVADGDDKTILSVWTEIMAAEGGVEWTVDVAWANAAQTAFQLPIRIRPQIGNVNPNPATVFDYPGAVIDYTQTESYEAGKGATTVKAVGNGQGTTRLQSDTLVDAALIANGSPDWVYRFSPATGLDDPVQLDLHAAQALAQMGPGSSVWTIVADANQAPHVGIDWGLGDSIGLLVETSLGHPDGASVSARAYGWDLDTSGTTPTVSPILIEGS